MKRCASSGCTEPAETNLKYCRGHEGGFDGDFVGRTEREGPKKKKYRAIRKPGVLLFAYGQAWRLSRASYAEFIRTWFEKDDMPELSLFGNLLGDALDISSPRFGPEELREEYDEVTP